MTLQVLQRSEWYGEPRNLGDCFRLTKQKGRRQLSAVCQLWTHRFGWELQLLVEGQLEASRHGRAESRGFSTPRGRVKEEVATILRNQAGHQRRSRRRIAATAAQWPLHAGRHRAERRTAPVFTVKPCAQWPIGLDRVARLPSCWMRPNVPRHPCSPRSRYIRGHCRSRNARRAGGREERR